MAATMRFTTFDHVRDNVPVTYEGWDAFAELFEKLTITTDKHSVKLYCPAEFADNRRLDRNVLHINFGVIDVDDYGEDAVMDALNFLTEEMNLQVIFHTTHRYAESLPHKFKCRIIIPFSRPVEVDEWDRVWVGMNELVNGIADNQCKNANRIYFFPSCPPGMEHLAFTEYLNSDGDVLDIDGLLEEVPHVPRSESFIKDIDPEKLARIAAEVRYQLAQIFLEQKFPPAAEGRRNSTAFRFSMTCGDFGLDVEAAWPLLADWNSRNVPPLDEDELRRTHESAYEGNARRLPFGWRLFDQAQGDSVEAKHVKQWAEKLAKKDGQIGRIGRRLEKVLKGDPIGTEAEQVFDSVAEALARHYLHADPMQLAMLMEESIKKTHDAGNRDITLEWVAHRIQQAQEDIQSDAASAQLDRKRLERLTIKDAFRSVKLDRTTPYTPGEILDFASSQDLETAAEFQRRWILRSGKTFYFFVGGQYVRRSQEEALNSAHELLLPAKLPMYRDSLNGGLVPLKLHELVEKYGSVVDKVYVDLTAQVTHYDWENKTIIEAPCPFRGLEPKYNKYVAKWLETLAPTDELHERLLDWLACVPKLKRPSCALFLYGAPNTGKSLLPAKLARLWREYGGPTELESLAANFNQEMQDCPIVFGDEFVPTDHRGDPKTDLLRKIIQEHDRTFKRKNIADAKLLGAIRLVISANKADIFVAEHKALTNNDIAAITERFLCIHVNPAAADFLADLKHNHMDDPEVSSIFLGDAIPRHVWWLHQNREVVDNDRLIVSGLPHSELALKLMVGTGLRSGLCQWFANYILATDEKRKMNSGVAPIVDTMNDGSSRLLVSAHMVHTLWSSFNSQEDKPRLDSLEKALGGICDQRTTKRINGKHHALRAVNLLRVKYWTAINDRASTEEFDAALEHLGLQVPYLDPAYLHHDD